MREKLNDLKRHFPSTDCRGEIAPGTPVLAVVVATRQKTTGFDPRFSPALDDIHETALSRRNQLIISKCAFRRSADPD